MVLAVCGDAGGAAAVAPVAVLLQAERRLAVRVLAYRWALAAFAGRGLAAEELTGAPLVVDAEARLRADMPALVLTGTSVGRVEPEKAFIAAARRVGVPSLAVLDAWSNYRARFGDATGALAYLPDRIALMDDRARAEMLADGFPAGSLVITGGPQFDSLTEARTTFGPEQRAALRSQVGAAPEERMVLFVSQPLSATYGEGLGYTERSVLALVLDALDTLAERHHCELTLAVHPHPREDPADFAWITSRRVRITLARGASGRAWALASDLVVGMSSILLLEACYLGCVTVSLQPGLLRPDTLPTNSGGLSLAVYDATSVLAVLEHALFEEGFRRQQQARLDALVPPDGAAARVVDLVGEMVGSRGPQEQP